MNASQCYDRLTFAPIIIIIIIIFFIKSCQNATDTTYVAYYNIITEEP